MPTYRVRFYSTYMDEYEVDAATSADAITMAQAYQETVGDTPFLFVTPETRARFAEKIAPIARHEYVDHDNTEVNELDADGNWLD